MHGDEVTRRGEPAGAQKGLIPDDHRVADRDQNRDGVGKLPGPGPRTTDVPPERAARTIDAGRPGLAVEDDHASIRQACSVRHLNELILLRSLEDPDDELGAGRNDPLLSLCPTPAGAVDDRPACTVGELRYR